nr:oligosaccharide flippase family protein [Chloroflexia bacterium]
MVADSSLPAPGPGANPALLTAAPEPGQGSGSLGSNVAWTISGNVGYAVCQWLILVALAKLGSPEHVGQFALGLGLTAPVMLLSNLNLRAVQATDTRNDHPFDDYVRLRIATTAAALLVCLGIVAFASLALDTALVVAFVALAKASESISDVYYGRLQKHERMERVARSMLTRGILSLAVMTILVWATDSVVWGSLGLFLTWLAVLVGYDIRFQGQDRVAFGNALRHSWRWRDLKPLLPLAWLALPLGIVQMLISLNVNVPRFFIQAVAGEHELGIYSAIAYVTIAGSTVVAAVGQAVSPRLARFHAERDRAAFIGLLGKLAIFFTACCAVSVAIVLVAGRP